MCVSFRPLNRVTKPFTFPIPRCADAIEDLGELERLLLWFISLDCRQGFHQISIRESDQEKTAFFTPEGDKECFTVMLFGPMNGPATYTAMMFELKGEWLSLFCERHPEHHVIVADNRIIIDDILNWCTDPEVLVDLFECICIVFLKYRISFRLDKCEFFVDIFEYVGHDITSDGNSPAQSKYDTI
jgi:hypothetical protein